MNEQTIKALAATAELMGKDMSKPAVDVLIKDLSAYPDEDICIALQRLRRDGKSFTLAEIIQRLPNMWPGAEEAWARFPHDESESGCVTAEMRLAWGACVGLDPIAARMAFKETYTRLVTEARSTGDRPAWHMSLGRDPDLREQATLDALEKGLISVSAGCAALPHLDPEELGRLAAGQLRPRQLQLMNQETDPANAQRIKQLIADINSSNPQEPSS